MAEILSAVFSEMSGDLSENKDRALISLIQEFTGQPVTDLHLAAKRCSIDRYPDGREVFSMDGTQLAEFYPVSIETTSSSSGYRVKATQKYRALV